MFITADKFALSRAGEGAIRWLLKNPTGQSLMAN
jgi:hypothetical protein